MVDKKRNNSVWWCCCHGGLFWGVIFLILGAWLLARDLGYISSGVSLWPIILIILGLWMILKRNNKC